MVGRFVPGRDWKSLDTNNIAYPSAALAKHCGKSRTASREGSMYRLKVKMNVLSMNQSIGTRRTSFNKNQLPGRGP